MLKYTNLIKIKVVQSCLVTVNVDQETQDFNSVHMSMQNNLQYEPH